MDGMLKSYMKKMLTFYVSLAYHIRKMKSQRCGSLIGKLLKKHTNNDTII